MLNPLREYRSLVIALFGEGMKMNKDEVIAVYRKALERIEQGDWTYSDDPEEIENAVWAICADALNSVAVRGITVR